MQEYTTLLIFISILFLYSIAIVNYDYRRKIKNRNKKTKKKQKKKRDYLCDNFLKANVATEIVNTEQRDETVVAA